MKKWRVRQIGSLCRNLQKNDVNEGSFRVTPLTSSVFR